MYASGLKNPTSFAWGDGTMFAGDSGSSQTVPNGGVDIITNGTATLVPNGPLFVGGMAWRDGALYLSDAYLTSSGPSFRIEKWSHFIGTDFSTRKVRYTAPKGLQGSTGSPSRRTADCSSGSTSACSTATTTVPRR